MNLIKLSMRLEYRAFSKNLNEIYPFCFAAMRRRGGFVLLCRPAIYLARARSFWHSFWSLRAKTYNLGYRPKNRPFVINSKPANRRFFVTFGEGLGSFIGFDGTGSQSAFTTRSPRSRSQRIVPYRCPLRPAQSSIPKTRGP